MKPRLKLTLFVLISTAVFCSATFADSATPGQYQVQSLDPDFDVSSFAAPNVIVHQAKPPKQDAADLLPSTEVRDRAFKKVGIADELAGWNQLDRDQLYLRARHMNEDRVLGYYPKLTKEKLIALIEMLHQAMREETVSK